MTTNCQSVNGCRWPIADIDALLILLPSTCQTLSSVRPDWHHIPIKPLHQEVDIWMSKNQYWMGQLQQGETLYQFVLQIASKRL